MRLETIDGQTYIRNETGRTFGTYDARRRVIEIVRNGERCEIDVPELLAHQTSQEEGEERKQ